MDDIVEFDTRPPITEAQFKSKIIAMSTSNKYQPIYDEFILETKEILPEILKLKVGIESLRRKIRKEILNEYSKYCVKALPR